jgi:hypothetical protein
MKKVPCSPYSKIHAPHYSCLTKSKLDTLKDQWNLRHPGNKINTTDEREIWEDLSYYMVKYLCNNEKCWLRKLISDLDIQNIFLLESFAPTMPSHWKKEPHSWLSDMDITRVMKQYESTFDNFVFIGPSPIDYDVYDKVKNGWVWPELKEFTLDKYIEHQPVGKTMIGIVFNLDHHQGKGTHWVALFINIMEGKIYYFDSNGNSIPSRIKKLTDTIKTQGKLKNIRFTLSTNYPKEHQRKNTECGIYVLYFIISMLIHNNWKHFKNETITDEEIFKYRKEFFSED